MPLSPLQERLGEARRGAGGADGRSDASDGNVQMAGEVDVLKRLYDRFNARDIETALTMMHPDVIWANGLEGGYVHGHAGVRDYWTRQWATIDSRADPLDYSVDADGTTAVEVHLTAKDREGNAVFDTIGGHIFRIEGGLIRRFDIRQAKAERPN